VVDYVINTCNAYEQRNMTRSKSLKYDSHKSGSCQNESKKEPCVLRVK